MSRPRKWKQFPAHGFAEGYERTFTNGFKLMLLRTHSDCSAPMWQAELFCDDGGWLCSVLCGMHGAQPSAKAKREAMNSTKRLVKALAKWEDEA